MAGELARRGLRVVGRRFRAAGGEIDLVATGAGTVHFVEVKARRTGTGHDPAGAIDAAKRRRIERAATAWLKRHRLTDVRCRFEAALVLADGERLEVRFVPF